TLADMISPGSEWVEVGGERRHVMSYLGDFLFPAQRARSPVRMLSGGERNRLLLARLFAQPANLLVLDEPTNDLDIESLELLEQKLQDYPGTLLLVSHDRRFLDNIVTQTLVAEGDGIWREYVGGYSDWLQQRSAVPESDSPGKAPRPDASRVNPTQPKPRTRLGHKEQRELASLPGEIESLEQEQTTVSARMSAPDYHLQGAAQIRADRRRLEEIEASLLGKFERWEALETERSRLGR
ncbi:MAG: ATP-binding cassette domain-containing protein, partial [Steroidobacteraceae bacterium]